MKTSSPSKFKENSDMVVLHKIMYKQIEDKVLEIGGDVFEIGAGTGFCLQILRLPEGSSLVVVDYNPHMEKYFRENLAKAPHINLKEYLVQSAEDMSNIPDNTFAAVFCADLMCSLEEELLRKMLKEIRRVLKKV
jgi:ubiquinone/menaquinone biosynthesis C-methylase UbiE